MQNVASMSHLADKIWVCSGYFKSSLICGDWSTFWRSGLAFTISYTILRSHHLSDINCTLRQCNYVEDLFMCFIFWQVWYISDLNYTVVERFFPMVKCPYLYVQISSCSSDVAKSFSFWNLGKSLGWIIVFIHLLYIFVIFVSVGGWEKMVVLQFHLFLFQG